MIRERNIALSVIFCIIICGIYGLYWAYKMGDKLDTAKQNRGIPASKGGVLYLIVYMFVGLLLTLDYIWFSKEYTKVLLFKTYTINHYD